MIRTLIAIAALVVSISAIAQSQVPNVFEDGTPASAAEVNENFEYVMENASGGCSVEQVDNTAEITCADGTTAVVPGYGTVVVYPEGVVGEVPPIDYDTGPIVVYDANDVLLGEVVSTNNGGVPIIGVLETEYPQAAIFNEPTSQSVILTTAYPVPVFYLEDNCQGLPFVQNGFNLVEINGAHYVPDTSASRETILMASRRSSAGGSFSAVYEPATACETLDLVKQVYPTAPYTPAPEILNAAYPVRLEQLP
jgi:hypothetical protein